jgi:hypothetical protein
MILEEVGKPARLQAAPKIVLRAIGLFIPPLRETIVMLYEFERAFGEHATPLEEAIGDSVRWYHSKLPAGGIRPAA